MTSTEAGLFVPHIEDMGQEEESKLLWAKALFEQRDFEGALEQCHDAFRLNPESAETHYFIALIHAETNEDALAESACKQALEYSSDMAQALLLLGRLYNRRGEYTAALKYYKRAASFMRDDPLILHLMADVLRHTQQPREAIKAYLKATKMEGEQYNSFLQLAELQFTLKNVKAAAKALASATQYKTTCSTYLLMGKIAVVDGRYKQALECFYQAIDISPYSFDAHLQAGLVLIKMNQPLLAMGQFRICLSFDANSITAHHYLGEVYRMVGKSKQAEQEFRRCVDIDSDYSPEALVSLG